MVELYLHTRNTSSWCGFKLVTPRHIFTFYYVTFNQYNLSCEDTEQKIVGSRRDVVLHFEGWAEESQSLAAKEKELFFSKELTRTVTRYSSMQLCVVLAP
jgi:hypothetical protein